MTGHFRQVGCVGSDGMKYGRRKLRRAVLVTGGKERTLKCRHIDFFIPVLGMICCRADSSFCIYFSVLEHITLQPPLQFTR